MTFFAIRILLGDTTKWLGVVLGIFLSTFLITHLLGMFNGMMQRTYALISDIPQADVWVMDPAVEYIEEPAGLPPTALQRVRGVDGVEWATPLISISLPVRLPGGSLRAVAIVGVDDATFVGAPETIVDGRIDDLRALDAVIVDTLAAQNMLRMPIAPSSAPTAPARTLSKDDTTTRPLRRGDELLVNDHRLVVVGFAKLGPRFLSRPVLYMPYTRALQIAPPQRNLLSYVLVHAKPGVNHESLARAISGATGLKARSAAEFSDDTYWYFVRTTGVVDRIAFMVLIGIVVGVCVSALLLYLFTAENSRYYAVLAAMGTQRPTIASMVIVQAIICGLIGYALGVGASCAVGVLLPLSEVPYLAVWWALLLSGAAVLFICVVAAVLSLRKVFSVEPAMCFQA